MKPAVCVLVLAGCTFAQSTISVTILNQKNTSVGVHGRLQNFLSTSFQPAEWDYSYFQQVSGSTLPLWRLAPQHIRIQPVSQGVPMTAPDQWDFNDLDAVLIPILALGDHSPELQLATAPGFMNDSHGNLMRSYFPEFRAYCANMVRYYNAGGFDAGGKHYQSASPYRIHWWGIFNEPNINGISAEDYVTLYNMVVPAMVAVDPTIKLVGIELSDFQGQSQSFVPPFVQGVKAQVDAIAAHYYSTCNQADTDEALMDSIWNFFAPDMQYLYSEIRRNPKLAKIPIWITENNVNADYDAGNGISACNGTPFVLDQRGTSAFFAAWRPYMFSLLAKAGAQSLYHWDYNADQQFGEADYNTGTTYLSYWVDYYLAHLFPSPPGADILRDENTNAGPLEVLAVRNQDGSIVVMLVNHHVRSALDNNGRGVPHRVDLDFSALGAFHSAILTTIDSSTNPAKGPVSHNITPSGSLQISLNGYSVAFLELLPAKPQFSAAHVWNAASLESGAVSPGEIITISGTNLGSGTPAQQQTSSPGVADNLLAGSRVWFDGIAAPLLSASARQVVAVVPYEIAAQNKTKIQVEYLGVMSSPVTMPVTASAPGLFTADRSGAGQAVAWNADGSLNSAANPSSAGSIVSLVATGEGQTNPAGADGKITGPVPPKPQLTVSAQIGGLNARVISAGGQTGSVAGTLIIQVKIPPDVASSPAVPVDVSIGTTSTQPGVTIAVH